MSNRYVALSCDAQPAYSLFLPIAVRSWAALGYTSILVCSDEPWDDPVGQYVLAEILPSTLVYGTGSIGNLSLANTMRCARLCASAEPRLSDADYLITSDVDIVPVGPEFNYTARAVAFRADCTAPLIRGGRIGALTMSYTGLHVREWRTLFGIDVGNLHTSLLRLVGASPDRHDLDESLLSQRILNSDLAQGRLEQLGPYRWRQGLLDVIAAGAVWAPEGGVVSYGRTPIGRAVNADEYDVLTLIPARPIAGWLESSVARFHPSLTNWLRRYFAQLRRFGYAPL